MNWDITVYGGALFEALNDKLVANGAIFSEDLVGFQTDDFADAQPGVYTDGEYQFVSK